MFIDITYCKERIREGLLTELTSDSGSPTGFINEDKLQLAIDTVESKVRNTLRKYYTLPLTAITSSEDAYTDALATVKDLCLRCLMYSLHSNAGLGVPPEFANAYLELDTYDTGESILHGCQRKSQAAIASSKSRHDKIYTEKLLRRQ